MKIRFKRDFGSSEPDQTAIWSKNGFDKVEVGQFVEVSPKKVA